MNVPEKHRALAHAWVDGAEIEFSDNGKTWHPIRSGVPPLWQEGHAYRIKPKPKVKRWRWAYGNGSYCATSGSFYTEEEAHKSLSIPLIKLPWTEIEVEE